MVWTLTTRSTEPSRRPFLRGLAAGGLLGGLALAAGSVMARDNAFGFWHTGRGCSGRHSSQDPLAAKERADFMADRLLDRVEATNDQRAKIKEMLSGALDDLMPIRAQHQSHRAAFVSALARPAVDRAELERLRKAELELADRASNTLVATLAAMAEVLNPDQRSKLAEMTTRWHGRDRGI